MAIAVPNRKSSVATPKATYARFAASYAVMNNKRKFPHHMLSEINEQPRTVRDTLAGRLAPETGTVALECLPLIASGLRSLTWIQIAAGNRGAGRHPSRGRICQLWMNASWHILKGALEVPAWPCRSGLLKYYSCYAVCVFDYTGHPPTPRL